MRRTRGRRAGTETEERRAANRQRFTKHRRRWHPSVRVSTLPWKGKREMRSRHGNGRRQKVFDDLSRRRVVDRDTYGFPARRVNTRTDKGSRVIYEGTSRPDDEKPPRHRAEVKGWKWRASRFQSVSLVMKTMQRERKRERGREEELRFPNYTSIYEYWGFVCKMQK